MLVPELKMDFSFDLQNVFVSLNKTVPTAANDAMSDLVIGLALLTEDRIKGREGLTRWPIHAPNTPTDSLPGTPPARITQNLLNSVNVDTQDAGRAGMNKRKFFASVYVDAEYALKQEEGFYNTVWKRNIPARPYIRPSFEWVSSSAEADRLMRDAADAIEMVWSNGR